MTKELLNLIFAKVLKSLPADTFCDSIVGYKDVDVSAVAGLELGAVVWNTAATGFRVDIPSLGYLKLDNFTELELNIIPELIASRVLMEVEELLTYVEVDKKYIMNVSKLSAISGFLKRMGISEIVYRKCYNIVESDRYPAKTIKHAGGQASYVFTEATRTSVVTKYLAILGLEIPNLWVEESILDSYNADAKKQILLARSAEYKIPKFIK